MCIFVFTKHKDKMIKLAKFLMITLIVIISNYLAAEWALNRGELSNWILGPILILVVVVNAFYFRYLWNVITDILNIDNKI